MNAIMNHIKHALIAEVQSKHAKTPFSEESKNDSHSGKHRKLRSVRNLSPNSMFFCVTYWMEGIVSCECGTCLVPRDATRNTMSQRFPNFTRVGTEALVMVDLKSNEHTTKQKIAPKMRTRKDTNQSFIVFRRVKSVGTRKRTSNGPKSFASIWTNSQIKDRSYVAPSQERVRFEKV